MGLQCFGSTEEKTDCTRNRLRSKCLPWVHRSGAQVSSAQLAEGNQHSPGCLVGTNGLMLSQVEQIYVRRKRLILMWIISC